MTWTTASVAALRHRLGVDRACFAKIVGTAERTVRRWETGSAEPTGASACVMLGLREKLNSDPANAERVVKFVVDAADVGGLPYLVLKLLEHVPNARED